MLLNGDGHTWVVMDYRGKTKEPSIVYIDVEEEVEFQIARSFSEFIEGLQAEEMVIVDEDEIEITDDMDMPEMEEITKEQAEHIFKTSNDEAEIIRTITNIDIDEEDINWMLDQLTLLLDRNNSEGVAERIAGYLLVHSYLRGMMDDTKYSLLMNKLKALPYTDYPISWR
ncbi:hypothetical protein CV093_10860 [Oceanobacillus sp. 143]|nr:hypothetical protein CV093_10860 [Oceanobacillus sp. 143]